MPLIPITFPVSQETAIASYSFTDIAEGTGVVVFFGSDTDDNGTVTYSLANNIVYSANILTEGTGTSGTEKILDIDFDVTFNMPQRIKGKVIANIPLVYGHESQANTNGKGYGILKVRHVTSGGAESELASNTKSKEYPLVASLDSAQAVLNIEVDVPLRHFKKGETLRMTVEIWANQQGGNGLHVGLMHDPKNRTPDSDDFTGGIDTGEFITSILSFNVPFVIDI